MIDETMRLLSLSEATVVSPIRAIARSQLKPPARLLIRPVESHERRVLTDAPFARSGGPRIQHFRHFGRTCGALTPH